MDDNQPDTSENNEVEIIPEVTGSTSTETVIKKDNKPYYILSFGIALGFACLAGAYIYVQDVQTSNSTTERVQEPPSVTEEEALLTIPEPEIDTANGPFIDPDGVASSTMLSNMPSSTTQRIEAQIPEDSRIRYKYEEFTYVDDSGEFTQYKTLDLDEQSFEYINEDYVKDAESLYYKGDLIPKFDPTDCTVENLSGCRHDAWRDKIIPYNLEVDWYDELASASSIFPASGSMCTSEGYEVGVVSNGTLVGSPVYMQVEQICGMWCGGYLERDGIHHVAFEDQFIKVRSEGFTISGIDDFPEKISIPNSNLSLLTLGPAGLISPKYEDDRFLFSDAEAGSIFDSGYGNYHSVRDDYVRMEYHLEFPFWQEDDETVLKIDFDDGTQNQESYSMNDGYGASFRISEVPSLENRLVRAGQFTDEHPVYSLVNSNDSLLQDLYNNRNTLASFNDGTNKYSYDEFISHRPLLYWQNPFGDWVKILNRKYETAAEKCKPVIYLYPEKTGEFEVYVEPNGGFTETIPEYGEGWKVISTPDSKITDKSTGEVYPYLYWEGINTGIPEITEGWVIDTIDTEKFFEDKLTVLGMNQKEIADFNEYWVDRLQTEGASQYKIMFLPQEYFDVMSPLTVIGDEKPASVIRVMMYAQAAEPGETLTEQKLPPTPKRYGFTVVEWGGAVFN